MNLLKIIILSFASLVELFLLTKFMGNKQISQLTMFDYVVGITIGSIAAEMATSLESNFLEPVTAMFVYGLVTVAISFITSKSLSLRRIIFGKTLILLDNGRIYRQNLKKAKIDLSEFLMQCRTNGYFNLSDIQTALLEPNGKISFLPSRLKRPVTPEDLNLDPQQEKIVTNVILDGKLVNNNLKSIGLNEQWLETQIKKQADFNINNIFLATVDSNKNLSIYIKYDKEYKHDKFQ